jgi:hypothetical protein
VTEVYVDVAAASVEPAGVDGSGPPSAEPEAVRALQYLADSGVRVVLVTSGEDGTPDATAAGELLEVASEVVTSVPAQPRGPAWYLTSDIARCGGATARLRTVLIGGAQPSGSVRRCDAVARDVQAAVMEILAAVAMPQRTEVPRA